MVSIIHIVTRFARLSSLALIICGAFLTACGYADSYGVQASVPYPTPTQAATFSGGTDGRTVQNASLTLQGACQVANPTLIVSIWRDGGSIGSTPCVSGAFSIQVMLREGLNNLIARTANASNLYGPDSQAVAITLQLPLDPQPPLDTVAGNEPATPAELVAATNSGAATDLQVTPSQPFSVIDNSRAVTIQVVVTGGQTPYTVMLNWGDGSTESHAVSDSGIYAYSHTYTKDSTYKVHGEVRDKAGAYTTFDYAVVSYKKSTGGIDSVPAPAAPNQTSGTNTLYTRTLPLILIGALLLGNFSYRLGYRRAPAAKIAKHMVGATKPKKGRKR